MSAFCAARACAQHCGGGLQAERRERGVPQKHGSASSQQYRLALNCVKKSELAVTRAPRWGEEGQLPDAVETLDRLVERGSYVDNSVFYTVLKRCIQQKDLVLGTRVHALAVKSGYESHAFLANHIICMYASHGRLAEATQVFTKVAAPNRYMWASIILAHARNGQPTEAIRLYRQMREATVQPDNHIFVAVLKACATAEDLSSGREVHADVLQSARKANMYVGNCLVHMYSRCGSFEDAQKVFGNLPTRDLVTWTAMIAGYAQHGLGQKALTLYQTMQQEGMTLADTVTFLCLLQACASIGSLHHGRQLHSQIQERGLEADPAVGNSLVNMYAKCGSLDDARRVFEKVSRKDAVTWNAIITGYAQRGQGEEALKLLHSMQSDGITPQDAVTFVCLLQACASIGALLQVRQIHSQIQQKGLEDDVAVGNCLISAYAKCGSLQDAQRLFNILPTKNVVTWTSMITAFAHHGLCGEALSVYRSMQQEGITPANVITFVSLLQACGSVAGLEKGKEIHAEISRLGLLATGLMVANALIDMYGKCGSMTDAQEVFDAMPARDIVSWSALMAGYARQGESELVFHLFHTLKCEGLQPDGITFLSVLSVCSHVGLVVKAQEYFDAMSKDYTITPTMEHFSCMVDLLGRAGYIDKAMETVKRMPFQPNGVVWRSVLGACRKWSNVELGRHAFECAVRLDKDDAATYVLMSNIYAAAKMQEDAKAIQAMRVKSGAWKEPGQSWWTDSRGMVHTFLAGDKNHVEWHHIDAKLNRILIKMEKEGYAPHLESNLRDIPDDEKESALCGHSERLAIAYALHKTPEGSTIRVVKNLRVCEDCHMVTALISKIEHRTIICRDASRFHVFKDGNCSCGNYW